MTTEIHEVTSGSQRMCKRSENFETAWKSLYRSSNWFSGVRLERVLKVLKIAISLSEAAEKADLPCFEGSLGEIEIPGSNY
ncbi:hypothetical protein ACET3Z_000048 [Daucus carota]